MIGWYKTTKRKLIKCFISDTLFSNYWIGKTIIATQLKINTNKLFNLTEIEK